MTTDVAFLKIKVDSEARRRKKVHQAWRDSDETGRRELRVVTSNNFKGKIMRLGCQTRTTLDS